MADFKRIIPLIKVKEGGLSKDPKDNAARRPVPDGSGNHTNKGITWGTFVDNAKALGYQPTTALFYQMPDNVWERIFKRLYWDAINGDNINSLGVAFAMTDFAFNSGPGNAARVMQQTLKHNFNFRLKEYGVIGPVSTNAINTTNAKDLLNAYHNARVAFIMQSNRIDESLKRGLVRRATDIYNFAAAHVTEIAVVSGGLLFFCLQQPDCSTLETILKHGS